MGSVSQSGDGGERKRGIARALLGPLLLGLAGAPSSTESAIANGDTRTITLSDSHTNESGSFTYMVNGYYDSAVLEKLNWFLRDWRLNESTKMDPKLFDIIWQVYRDSGSKEPIDVLSGYRSPQTNAMLRRRSRQVAEHSQHMEGRAVDAHFVDVSTATIRDIAMRMQSGGVGFYPTGSTPWVHIDSGSVRYWPRMSRDALARLFPDGKTVFIPSDGQPMPGYELARAEIAARGGAIQTAGGGSANFGLLGFLFGPRGGGADDAEEDGADSVVTAGRGMRASRGGTQVASAAPDVLASAKSNLPRGQTFAQPAAPEQPPAPTLISAREPIAAAPQPTPSLTLVAAQRPVAPPPSSAPQVVAVAEADNDADSGPVSLRGPIAAKFIAPLPPRKPADLGDSLEAFAAPLPPTRPVEFTLAVDEDQPVDSLSPSARNDLVAALLEHGKLPRVITRGVGTPPVSALALAETNALEPPDRPALMARAAALTAPLPPLPPVRAGANAFAGSLAKPAAGETSIAPPRTPAAFAPELGATRARKDPSGHGASVTNPYGDLIYDAFKTDRAAPNVGAAILAEGLRGAAQ